MVGELNAAAPVFVPTTSFLLAPPRNDYVTNTTTNTSTNARKIDRHQNKHQRKRNRHRTKKKQTKHIPEPLSLFPPLCQHQQIHHETKNHHHWSQIALQGHEAAEESRRLQEEEEQRLLHCTTLTLTPLTKQQQTPLPIDATTKEESDTVVQEKPVLATNIIVKPIDMTKLRDRWWDLIAEKRDKDLSHSEDDLEETNTIYSDTSSSAQSLVDISTFPQEAQIYNHVSPTNDKSIDYQELDFPLHRAVMDDNEVAVKGLLARKQGTQSIHLKDLGLSVDTSREILAIDLISPIQLAVYLDKAKMVQLLLSGTKVVVSHKDECSRNPLMLAAELGHESCIQVFLSHNTPYVTARDTRNGNSVLHYACRAGISAETMKALLLQSTKGLLSQNNHHETPLHVACRFGHAHLVDIILQQATTSTRHKVLTMLDLLQQTPLLAAVRAEATDAVMALLRWKGNGRRTLCSSSSGGVVDIESEQPCPLVWAVSLGSMEMIHLLLEFRDSSFRVDDALYAALRSTEDTRDDMIRLMIEAGANPCHSALDLGASRGEVDALRVLLDTYKTYLTKNQQARRQDPQLSKQGDFYFRAIEARETSELQIAMTEALLKSMFLGWAKGDSSCLECSLLLFQKGADLDKTGIARLKQSMKAKMLKTAMEVSADDDVYIFETIFVQLGPPISTSPTLRPFHQTPIRFWSDALLQSDWMKAQDDGLQCAWLRSEARSTRKTDDLLLNSLDVVVLIAEGQKFSAHSLILDQKSGKLAAAIRFATMNRVDAESPIEIDIGISAKLCQWLLQHIYHGSIVSGWDFDPCNSILELALVAEEFLCKSLLLECEMRLLASNPTACFCWSCCVAARRMEGDAGSCPMTQSLYRARGPSQLLTASTSMNALAVCQQLSSAHFVDESYELKFWPKPLYPQTYQSTKKAWVNYQFAERILTVPFAAVQDAAIAAILLHFPKVLKSEAFICHLRAVLDENSSDDSVIQQEREVQLMLLQMCLDEMAQSLMIQTNSASSKSLESSGLSGAMTKLYN